MKSIYLFAIAVVVSVIAINFFINLDAIFYGVVCIFISMVLVEYGIATRLNEERQQEKDEYLQIKIAELVEKKTKKQKDFVRKELKRAIKKHHSADKLSKKDFMDFLGDKKIIALAKRMKKNGASYQMIGKEVIKKFEKSI